MRIRLGSDSDIEELVALSLLAWAPVFESFRHILGSGVFSVLYPDWHVVQTETVTTYCSARENRVLLVAEEDGKAVGFLVYNVDHQDKKGEVQLLAVHPDYQNRGFGTELNRYALAQMKESGMKMASVSTGGDPSHAPARRSYEKAGFRPFPQVWYFTDL